MRAVYAHGDQWRHDWGPVGAPNSHENLFSLQFYHGGALVLYALRQAVGTPTFARIQRAWVRATATGRCGPRTSSRSPRRSPVATCRLPARLGLRRDDAADAGASRLDRRPGAGGGAHRARARARGPAASVSGTLHVTNGGSAAARIRAAGLGGDVLPWDDVLHEGPLTDDRAARARFLAAHGWGEPAALAARLAARDDRLARALGAGEPIVLWFEHDLYDQLQLLQVLVALGDAPADLIQATEFLGERDTELAPLWAGGRR